MPESKARRRRPLEVRVYLRTAEYFGTGKDAHTEHAYGDIDLDTPLKEVTEVLTRHYTLKGKGVRIYFGGARILRPRPLTPKKQQVLALDGLPVDEKSGSD